MDFMFVIEKYIQEDCKLRVCFKVPGKKDRRAFVSIPVDVMERQDLAEIKKYVVLNAPIKAWTSEERLKSKKRTKAFKNMLGIEQAVTSTEYANMTQPSTNYNETEVV